MPNLSIVSPKGDLYNDDVDFVLVKSDQGEVGILKDHVPIILKISDGFIKIEANSKETYVCVINGILSNNNNKIIVVAEEAEIGENYDEAKAKLLKQREDVKKNNRQRTVDFVEAEKELAKAIKETKASKAI